jgi:hypothetical protein
MEAAGLSGKMHANLQQLVGVGKNRRKGYSEFHAGGDALGLELRLKKPKRRLHSGVQVDWRKVGGRLSGEG